jgi:hypothetical protein
VRGSWLRLVVFLALGAPMPTVLAAPSDQRAHTVATFTFLANGAMADVFPLFGAAAERKWAPGWDPSFIWPLPANDTAGMVFHILRGGSTETWVNTVFDPATGRVQYVYLRPAVVATSISVQVTVAGNGSLVNVTYERTSLTAESDAAVRRMADGDRRAGPEWAGLINGYLATRAGRPGP